MGLLLLLTYTLLSDYFHPGCVVNAQRLFMIREINLSIEPSTDVTRDTNVTLRCQAIVSSSGQEALSREYTIYKDSSVVYTKTSRTSEDLLYPLNEARVSDSGKYQCKITIEGKQMTSDTKKLTVTGLARPVLNLNKSEVSEGEEITARCSAPSETGSILFYFFKDSKEILEKHVTSNQVEVKLPLRSVGIHRIHCAYTVVVTPYSFKSEDSRTATVSVKELPISAVLEIFPRSKIYEGDQLVIECTIRPLNLHTESIRLLLTQGAKILSHGYAKVNHSMVALAKDPGEFACILEYGDITKTYTKTVSVTELFTAPTLTMSPAEVFRKQYMTLTCKSESFASERISREDLTYTLDPPESPLMPKGPGVFSGMALLIEFNYTCEAQAKGIKKRSKILTVRPKESVSAPKISVEGPAVLGQYFKIVCQSDRGSPPINYTLLKGYDELRTITVEPPLEKATFKVVVTKPEDINKFMCQARNSHKEPELSKRLNATIIMPLEHATLTVIPHIPEISEGDDLYLICGVKGTPPVTFRWYRVGYAKALNNSISNTNNTDYRIPRLSKEDSGTYYCEAVNHAGNLVRSDPVTIEVRMALWKKVLIGGVCLLALSVLVVVLVLCFKSKRGKKEAAAELSVKPSSPKSDDSLTVNLTHDTEVYNAATVRVDKAAVSVWSERPPEAADDEKSSVASNEPDVEYTEVVHPRPVDPARVPLRKGTDTVYTELQNSPHGAADHHDYGSVEYAELNNEQPEINQYCPEVNNHQDLPAVD